MFQASHNNAKQTTWRQALVMSLAIGMSVAVGSKIQEMMGPAWGFWEALGMNAMAAGATGGLVALMGMLLLRKR